MAYEKRVCVMKQVKKGFSADGSALSGAVYCERLGKEITLTPRLLGLAPVREGYYMLALIVQKQTFCLEYTGTALIVDDAPSIKDGLSLLLCYVRAGVAEPVLYGACGQNAVGVEGMMAALTSEKKKKRPANPLPPNQLPAPMPNVPLAPTPAVPEPLPDETEEKHPFRSGLAAAYDDEAIADANYYVPRDENEVAGSARKKKGKTDARGGDSSHDEADPPRAAERGTLTYYNAVRGKIEEAFSKFPRDERLQNTFPQSAWANLGEACLGVVYEEGLPRYLCVARSEQFPDELGQKGIFVPFTTFSDSEGMYVVFQDADTGAYVTVGEG